MFYEASVADRKFPTKEIPSSAYLELELVDYAINNRLQVYVAQITKVDARNEGVRCVIGTLHKIGCGVIPALSWPRNGAGSMASPCGATIHLLA